MNELGGEKIDIIEYREDIEGYLAQALSPAKIHHVKITDPVAREAKVYVKELSLAIGKGGQNVRLAAKLTGYKIDIVEYGAEGEAGAEDTEAEQSAEALAEESDEGASEAEEQNAGAKKE
jgi:N utilization substance protein A